MTYKPYLYSIDIDFTHYLGEFMNIKNLLLFAMVFFIAPNHVFAQDNESTEARMLLIYSILITIHSGLSILSIKPMEKM